NSNGNGNGNGNENGNRTFLKTTKTSPAIASSHPTINFLNDRLLVRTSELEPPKSRGQKEAKTNEASDGNDGDEEEDAEEDAEEEDHRHVSPSSKTMNSITTMTTRPHASISNSNTFKSKEMPRYSIDSESINKKISASLPNDPLSPNHLDMDHDSANDNDNENERHLIAAKKLPHINVDNVGVPTNKQPFQQSQKEFTRKEVQVRKSIKENVSHIRSLLMTNHQTNATEATTTAATTETTAPTATAGAHLSRYFALQNKLKNPATLNIEEIAKEFKCLFFENERSGLPNLAAFQKYFNDFVVTTHNVGHVGSPNQNTIHFAISPSGEMSPSPPSHCSYSYTHTHTHICIQIKSHLYRVFVFHIFISNFYMA
ncbi:hypothetical protein RFI_22332, partial [Reticulomyxa filosa]